MCIAVPGQIKKLDKADELMASGEVDFGGVKRTVNLAFVPEAEVGDWVLVHAGFALSRIDEKEAGRIIEDLREVYGEEEDDS